MENIIQLGICLAALVWIVWLFLGYGAKSKSGVTNKVHTLYLSGIGTLVILELIVYICLHSSHKDNILETISFGATLSSLIMSVVAIIFTIVSGKNNNEQLGKIDEATTKLKETAHSLAEFSVIAKNIELKTEELGNNIRRIGENQTNMYRRIEEMHKTADRMGEIRQIPKDDKVQEAVSIVTPTFIGRSPYFGVLGLIACVYGFAKDKRVSLDKLAETIGFPEVGDYIHGYLIGVSTLDIIKLKTEDGSLKVLKVSEDIENICMSRIAEQIKDESNADDKAFSMFNKVRVLFDYEPMSKKDILSYIKGEDE